MILMNIYLLNEKSKISMKCGTVVLFLWIKTKAFLLKTEFMSGRVWSKLERNGEWECDLVVDEVKLGVVSDIY